MALAYVGLFGLVAVVGLWAILRLSASDEPPPKPKDPLIIDENPVDPSAATLKKAQDTLREALRLIRSPGDHQKTIESLLNEATGVLTGLIEARPNLAAAFYHRSGARLHLRQYDAALDDVRKASSIEPGSGPVFERLGLVRLERHMSLHRLARLRGDPVPLFQEAAEVARDFRSAERLGGETVDRDFCDVAATMLEGRYRQAQELADRVIARSGRDEWYKLRAILAELEGNEVNAGPDFDRCLERRPNAWDLHLGRALARRAAGDAEGAERDATAYLRIAADPLPVHLLRAEMRERRRDHRGALEDAQAVLGKDPLSQKANLAAARAQVALRRFDAARAHLEVVLKQLPSDADALLLLSRIHFWNGDVRKAEDVVSSAVAAHRSNSGLLVARSEIRLWKGEHAQALRDAEEAVRLAPKSARTLCARADARLAREEIEEALKDYREAKIYDPRETRAHRGLANALLARGEPESARKAILTALEGEPNNLELRIVVADLLRLQREHEKALSMLNQVIQTDGEIPDAYWARARLWRDLKDRPKMDEDLERAVQLRPRDQALLEAFRKTFEEAPPAPPPDPPK